MKILILLPAGEELMDRMILWKIIRFVRPLTERVVEGRPRPGAVKWSGAAVASARCGTGTRRAGGRDEQGKESGHAGSIPSRSVVGVARRAAVDGLGRRRARQARHRSTAARYSGPAPTTHRPVDRAARHGVEVVVVADDPLPDEQARGSRWTNCRLVDAAGVAAGQGGAVLPDRRAVRRSRAAGCRPALGGARRLSAPTAPRACSSDPTDVRQRRVGRAPSRPTAGAQPRRSAEHAASRQTWYGCRDLATIGHGARFGTRRFADPSAVSRR